MPARLGSASLAGDDVCLVVPDWDKDPAVLVGAVGPVSGLSLELGGLQTEGLSPVGREVPDGHVQWEMAKFAAVHGPVALSTH